MNARHRGTRAPPETLARAGPYHGPRFPTGPWITALVAPLGAVLIWAPIASAAGINLSWNECSLGSTATSNLNFACDTNEGQHTLVASFVPFAELPDVVGLEAVLDLRSESCPLGNWWQFQSAGSCRPQALTVTARPPPDGSACAAAVPEPTIEGFLYSYPSPDDQGARIFAVAAVPINQGRPLAAGVEYLALRIVIQNTNTTGEAPCGGCGDPVCVEFRELSIVQPDAPLTKLDWPDARHLATWQGGPWFCGIIFDPPLPHDCVTPTRRTTWGQVKSLYR